MDVFQGEKGEGKNESDLKAPSAIARVQEKNGAVVYKHHPHHHHESHGTDETIEQDTPDTPVEDVKAPNVFERAKEEIEAVVQHFHDKKKAHQHSENKSEDQGCWTSIGHKLERFCGSHNSTRNTT